jgi:hypothetical protein
VRVSERERERERERACLAHVTSLRGWVGGVTTNPSDFGVTLSLWGGYRNGFPKIGRDFEAPTPLSIHSAPCLFLSTPLPTTLLFFCALFANGITFIFNI